MKYFLQQLATDETGALWDAVTDQQLLSDVLLSGAWNRQYPLNIDRNYYRARTFTTGSMTAGSPLLSVSGYVFSAADLGKTVGIKGPGVVSNDYTAVANDGVLAGTIIGVSAGNAVLSVNAATTASNCPGVFGIPIDAPLAAAVSSCAFANLLDGLPGRVVIPGGQWIAVNPLPLSSGVSIGGVGRDLTQVFVVKVVPDANDSLNAPWLRRVGGTNLYDNVNVTDITLIGTYYACSGVYGPDMKMISISRTLNSCVMRTRIVDNPSTAIGYDESLDCEIAYNVVLNAGRVATPSASNGSAGGSAIGVAVGGTTDVSINIHHNFLQGKWTASGGTGRSGINIEAASNIVDPPLYYGGLTIECNTVEGYFNGIVDSGGLGTIIQANRVRRCTHGIKAGTNNISVGRIARDASIMNNDVYDLFSAGPAVNSIGIAATTASATKDAQGRTKISGNKVKSVAGGYGIQLLGTPTYPLRNVSVVDNLVAECYLSGIRVNGNVFALVLALNQCVSNGKAGVSGNTAPIRVDANVVWQDGRIDGNTYTDYASVPTQSASIVFQSGSSLTNVTQIA